MHDEGTIQTIGVEEEARSVDFTYYFCSDPEIYRRGSDAEKQKCYWGKHDRKKRHNLGGAEAEEREKKISKVKHVILRKHPSMATDYLFDPWPDVNGLLFKWAYSRLIVKCRNNRFYSCGWVLIIQPKCTALFGLNYINCFVFCINHFCPFRKIILEM